MSVTRPTVYSTIRSSKVLVGEVVVDPAANEAEETGVEVDVTPAKRSAASRYTDVVEERLDVIDEMMEERSPEGVLTIRSARDVRRRLWETTRKTVSLRQIQRDLNTLGHAWKALPVVPAMKPAHIAKRLAAATSLDEYDHRDILFSDESFFDCNIQRRGAWQRDGEPQEVRPRERYTSKAMVWGVIGYNFSLLVILNDTVNSENYAATLKQFLFPRIEERHWFMQDGARPHTSALVLSLLQEQRVSTIDWPPKSPDLNPIENIWGMMKSSLDVDLFASVEELEDGIRAAWDGISQERINDLVDTFPERLRKLRKAKGGPIQVKSCYK
jgi:transposase